MSSHEVISVVSMALRDILWERYHADPAIDPLFPSQENSIVFDNPTETVRQGVGRLSLWLYQVAENEHLKNQPPIRLPAGPAGDAAEEMTPLAVDLYYLVTPFLPSGPEAATIVSDHLLLGLTMQALYDNAIVVLRDPTRDVAEELPDRPLPADPRGADQGLVCAARAVPAFDLLPGARRPDRLAPGHPRRARDRAHHRIRRFAGGAPGGGRMSVVIETRREQPQLILDVGDGFVASRARVVSRRPRPRGQLRARVLARSTAPAETFSPAWQLVTTPTPGGVHAWFGRVRPDVLGVPPELDRVGVLQPGTYDVELAAPGYQPATVQAAVPAPGMRPSVVTVDLQPGPEYRFPDEVGQVSVPAGSRSTGPTLIRGQILALDGSGLAGITVRAPGVPPGAPSAPPALTDRSGAWVLVFPDGAPAGPIMVTATIDGAAVTATAEVVIGQRTVVPQARLRGRTVRQSGAPAEGAAISVAGVPGAVSSGPDGSWSIALPFGIGLQPTNVTVTAVLGATTRTQTGIGVVPGTSVAVPDYVFPNP